MTQHDLLPALTYYRFRFSGESWTPDDVADDVRSTCLHAGWTEEQVKLLPDRAVAKAVEIWRELDDIQGMMEEVYDQP